MDELKETVDLMLSDDYRERFKAEYYQTKIRYEKLHEILIKAESGTLEFKLKCSLDVLTEQISYMGHYLHMLEIRAELEEINL